MKKATPGSAGVASWMSRRKLLILTALVVLTLVVFFVKEKYFYRADMLIAVQRPKVWKKKLEVSIEKTKASIWSYLGYGGEGEETKKINVWDEWMDRNPQLTSIGNIYDKCDNVTRTKVGKVVLEPTTDSGVRIISYVNQTYRFDITAATSHMKVFYQDDLLYEKDYDMCEQAPLLDTPHNCPFKAGKMLVIRDAATLPSYIPKGQYKIEVNIRTANGTEIGCTFAEFKTGEDEAIS